MNCGNFVDSAAEVEGDESGDCKIGEIDKLELAKGCLKESKPHERLELLLGTFDDDRNGVGNGANRNTRHWIHLKACFSSPLSYFIVLTTAPGLPVGGGA